MASLLFVGLCARAIAADTECLVAFEAAGGRASRGGLDVDCRDGDPTCDTGAVVDGVCTVDVTLCLAAGDCAAGVPTALRVRGRAGLGLAAMVPTPMPASGLCIGPASVAVPAGRRRRVRVRATAGDGSRDRDRLRVRCRRADSGRAIVVTTDFESGLLARVRVARPHRPRSLDTPIHSDAVIRIAGGETFVLNRFLGDNVQILNAAGRTRLQCTTGAGSNPHDVAVVAPDKGYVTRYDRRRLWVIDPSATRCSGFQRGTIDLAAVADGDGLPEMSQMALVGTRLFVAVQRLDRRRGFSPTGPSSFVVIDTTTDTIESTVALLGQNAFGDASGIQRRPGSTELLLAQAGNVFHTGDGGIELFDPDALASRGFLVTEERLGGSVTDFVMVSATKGYAIVLDTSLRNLLVAFDTTADGDARRVFASERLLPDVALAPDGRVWLATRAGIRIFDASTDESVLRRPLDLGLPPFSMGFLP